MDLSVHSSDSGPLFNGQAEAAMTAFISQAEEDIAQNGVNLVRAELGQVLKHPTGMYESRIQTANTAGDSVVSDGGVIYGPWLEGTGERNKTTRFKGYSTFRRITARVQASATEVAERTLPNFLRRMS